MSPADIHRKLEAVGYYADLELAAEIALLLADDGEGVRAMLLDGPPGAGKTFLAKSVARVMGVDYIYVQAHPGSAPEDFLYDANIVQILRGVAGDRDAVKSAEDVVDLGFLPLVFRASQHGLVVAFVDELDKASPKTDSLFLAALQEGEVCVKGLGRIKANRNNLLLFFTKNNERAVSEPLMRRCRRFYLGFPEPELESRILREAGLPAKVAEALVGVAGQLRARQEDLIKPPASQELIKAGFDALRLVEWGVPGQVGATAFRWLAAYQEDQQILRTIMSEEQLGNLLVAAVKTSGTTSAAARQAVAKPDGEFVTFGRP